MESNAYSEERAPQDSAGGSVSSSPSSDEALVAGLTGGKLAGATEALRMARAELDVAGRERDEARQEAISAAKQRDNLVNLYRERDAELAVLRESFGREKARREAGQAKLDACEGELKRAKMELETVTSELMAVRMKAVKEMPQEVGCVCRCDCDGRCCALCGVVEFRRRWGVAVTRPSMFG